jgi:hypothetical protein
MADMIRRCLWILTFLGCSGLVAAEPARSETKTAAAPACIYESKSYSDGAYICIQKSLMLNCSSDGARATWKIVADKDLSERCVAPTALSYPPVTRRHARRMRAIRHGAEPAQQSSAKCFYFNNKQYCE